MSEGHRVFAFVYPILGWLGERFGGFAERRRRLLTAAEGRVVEIGAGNGLNFRHYPAGVEVVATDPDPHMLKRARKNARKAPVSVSLEQAPAEALPLPDASVDTVVSTLVLCSVPDQAVALAEAKRVLKPGGKLLFLEHVRSHDPELAETQDRREKLQMRVGAGCRPNRDTLAAIVAAGFEPDTVEHRTFPGAKHTRPGVTGVARKPA
jgi:ubiquinone/menaquinone biosynthesis C-methylase UbiE